MTDSQTTDSERISQGTAGGFKRWGWTVATLAIILLAIALFRFWKPPETAFDHAVALIKQGKAAAALPVLEQLSTQHPAPPAVYPWLAQGYLSTDRIAEGRIALDTALRVGLSPQELVPSVLLFANYYQRKGDFEEAEKLLQCVPSNLIREDLARFYVDWADSELNHNNLEGAVKHLEIASSFASSISGPLQALIPHRLSEGYRRLAAVAEQNENDEPKAMALLEKSVRTNDEPATRMLLASLYNRNNMPDKAIESYRVVVAVDKNNLEARHHLIDLLLAKNDYDGAQKALVELTDKEKSVENCQQLAAADLKLNNYAGAVHALEDAYELHQNPDLLHQLLDVLNDWTVLLLKQKKVQEANSVQGHASRVQELLAKIAKDEKAERDAEADKANALANKYDPSMPPIILSSSRIWLATGSVTPEGEIKIKNISGANVGDLTLKAVFYDKTAKKAAGSVTLPVATPNSVPFKANDTRTLYFSCPSTVKTDHQLAVILMWKNRLLKEFPVVKQL
jgi:tetratricopeptide (TPR) repeat protein